MCRMLWVMYDAAENSWQEGLPMAISKTLKRRYFLVEKAKNASVIGVAQHLPSWHQMFPQSILTTSAGCSYHDRSQHITGLPALVYWASLIMDCTGASTPCCAVL